MSGQHTSTWTPPFQDMWRRLGVIAPPAPLTDPDRDILCEEPCPSVPYRDVFADVIKHTKLSTFALNTSLGDAHIVKKNGTVGLVSKEKAHKALNEYTRMYHKPMTRMLGDLISTHADLDACNVDEFECQIGVMLLHCHNHYSLRFGLEDRQNGVPSLFSYDQVMACCNKDGAMESHGVRHHKVSPMSTYHPCVHVTPCVGRETPLHLMCKNMDDTLGDVVH